MRFVIAGAALIGLGVVLLFGPQLAGRTLEEYDQIASIVSMFAGLASLVIAIRLRQKPALQVVDETAQRNHAAETLAEAVQVYWEEEARVRNLHRPTPLRLHWLTTERPVTPPASTIVGNAVGGGQVTQVRFHGHLRRLARSSWPCHIVGW